MTASSKKAFGGNASAAVRPSTDSQSNPIAPWNADNGTSCRLNWPANTASHRSKAKPPNDSVAIPVALWQRGFVMRLAETTRTFRPHAASAPRTSVDSSVRSIARQRAEIGHGRITGSGHIIRGSNLTPHGSLHATRSVVNISVNNDSRPSLLTAVIVAPVVVNNGTSFSASTTSTAEAGNTASHLQERQPSIRGSQGTAIRPASKCYATTATRQRVHMESARMSGNASK